MSLLRRWFSFVALWFGLQASRALPRRKLQPERSLGGLPILSRWADTRDEPKERHPKPPYIQTLSDWDSDTILAAINEHERGNMEQSGLLWKWCLRDDRIKTAMNV